MRKASFVLTLAACAIAAPGRAQVDFTNYVSLGDSLTAGFSSGALVESHQNVSYPALIARAGGAANFQQPLVSEPGIPAELQLRALVPAPLIVRKSLSLGQPTNLRLPRPYNNLAVPGSTSADALTRVSDNGGLHDLVLRGLGTQVQQAVASRPTVMTIWIGNNDVLGAAVSGRAIPGVTFTPPPVFRAIYTQIIQAARSTGAKIFAANLPDVSTIPYVTTVRPFIEANGQRIPLLGPGGALSADTLVLLPASAKLARGIGLPPPIGTGIPLADEDILDPAEVATIRAAVNANNQAIAEICGTASIPVLDINAFLREFATTGRVVGGVRLSSAFLTGGLFSYDGVHATDLGYAIVANEWINLINRNGGSLPAVDLSKYLGVGSQAATRPAASFIFSEEAQKQVAMIFGRVDGR